MTLSENMKTIVLAIAIVSATAGALNYFATKDSVAAVSLKVQQAITQQRAAWLEQQVYEIEKQYGSPPRNCPARILNNWRKWTKELELKYELLKEIDKRLVK